MTKQKFWLQKKLTEMTRKEWESLCDGCGKCCVNVLEDEEDGSLYQTNVSCHMLNHNTCRCKDYRNRKKIVPSCVSLTPKKLAQIDWLPDSCAYVMVEQGKDLPPWHHLQCGDRDRIHREGRSVQGRVISELNVVNLEDHIVPWFE